MLKKDFKGRRKIAVFVLILLVSFALMTVNIKRSHHPTWMEAAVLWLVSPFQNFFTFTLDTLSDGWSHYVYLARTAQENEALRAKIDRLNKRNRKLEEEVRHLARLHKLFEYKGEYKLNAVTATVIGRDATQWAKTIIIDKGTRDGLKEDLPVVTDAGIVGHVIQAGFNTSKVLLITDTRSAVDSLFKDDRVSGVVVGTGGDACVMKYVPIQAEIKVGDKVLSSGLGGVFPKGLLVGSVGGIQKATQGLFQEISILPGADLTRLEEVLVLIS